MPLYAVLARAYFGPHIIGAVFGSAGDVPQPSAWAGPAIGGWIYDTSMPPTLALYARPLLVVPGAAAAIARLVRRPMARVDRAYLISPRTEHRMQLANYLFFVLGCVLRRWHSITLRLGKSR